MIERRSHPRVKVSHPALFSNDLYPRPRVATTVDLSLGGTRIETPYSLLSGEDVDISFAVHSQVIQCSGQVVHVSWQEGEKLEAGVRFEDMSKQDRDYLGQYVSSVIARQASGVGS